MKSTAKSEKPIAVYMVTPNRTEANRIAKKLVQDRLAACVNIFPEVRSVYRWKNKVEFAYEVVLIAKTVQSKFAELQKVVMSLHSYEVPAIVILPLEGGLPEYFTWLQDQVGAKT